MQQLSGAFRSLPKPSGRTQGSVPVPADAACAQMPPLVAHAAPLGLSLHAALRDISSGPSETVMAVGGVGSTLPPAISPVSGQPVVTGEIVLINEVVPSASTIEQRACTYVCPNSIYLSV